MRSLFSKFSLLALAAMAVALFLLAPSDQPAQADHELAGANGNAASCGNMPTTGVCAVDFVSIDMDPGEDGNAANLAADENTGDFLPLGELQTCRELASSATFNVDIVIDAIPDINGIVGSDDTDTVDGASLIQTVIAYDNDKLSLGTVNQYLEQVGDGTILGTDPQSGVGLAGPATITELDAGAGAAPRVVVVLHSLTGLFADATVDGTAGVFARLPFTATADGFAEISVLGSFTTAGPIITSTKIISRDNDVFTITNLYGGDGLTETVSTAADNQEATGTAAIGGGLNVCGGTSTVNVVKSNAGIVDTNANNCASGEQTLPISGATDTDLCVIEEILTVTATATLTNVDPSDALAVTLTATVNANLPSDCSASVVAFTGDATGNSPQSVTLAAATAGDVTATVTETVTLDCDDPGTHSITIDNVLTCDNPTQTCSLTDGSVTITDFEVIQIADVSVSSFAPADTDFGLDLLPCTTDATGFGIAGSLTYGTGPSTLADTNASFPVTSGATLDAVLEDDPSPGVTTLVDAAVFGSGDLAGQVLSMTNGPASGESQTIRVHIPGSFAVLVANFSSAPVATNTYDIESLVGRSVTVSSSVLNHGLVTRTITGHTATELTVTPEWAAIAGSGGVAAVPNTDDPYAVAHATGAGAGLPIPNADDANEEVGNSLCAALALSEIGGGPASSSLPRLTTRDESTTSTALAFSKTLAGVTPAVSTLDHVSVSLPDLIAGGGVDSIIDFALGGVPDAAVSTVTAANGICEPTTSTQSQLVSLGASPSINIDDQFVRCTNSSFVDSDLSGAGNFRVQMFQIVNILDFDGVLANGVQFTSNGTTPDLFVVDPDPSNNIGVIANFDVGDTPLGPGTADDFFGIWSLPKFEPVYRSVIGSSLTLPLVTQTDPDTGFGEQNPANNDQCVTLAPCATGTYFSVGDSNLTFAAGIDSDFDGVADEVEDFQPLAGAIAVTPGDWLVQTGVDVSASINALLDGVPNGTSVGSFRATVRAGDPTCQVGMIDVPVPPSGSAALEDAQMPLSQPWGAAAGGTSFLEAAALAEGGADAVFDIFTGSISTGGAANIVEDGSNRLIGFDFIADAPSVLPSAGEFDGLFLTFTSGPSTGKARIIDVNTESGGIHTMTVSEVSPSEGFTSPHSAADDTFVVTAINSADLFPSNLLFDPSVVGLIGGADGDPATADGPPMWYRYVGVADTKGANDSLTPVNVVAFNAGPVGYLSISTTANPGFVLAATTATCTPFVAETEISAVAGITPLRIAISDGPQQFAQTFVRADTGGKVLVLDTSLASSETNITLTRVDLDQIVTVAADLSASEEARPDDPDGDDDGDGIPDQDETGPDRVVSVTVDNGVGSISSTGVDVEVIAVSGLVINDFIDVTDDVDCEVRWDLTGFDVTNSVTNNPVLVQRLTIGDIDLDRISYNTGAMGPGTDHEQTVSYDITCTGDDTEVGAGLPAVTAIASIALGIPPEPASPGSADNSNANSTTVTLTQNADSDSQDNVDDNCPFTTNEDQRNADANDATSGDDETGNACDTDDDNDGVADVAEVVTCTPGIGSEGGPSTGPNLAALSAGTLTTYQEDPDAEGIGDGCRDVDLGIGYSGTEANVDKDTDTSIGPVTATVTNVDQFISAEGVLTTTIVSRSLLPGEAVSPDGNFSTDDAGCQVDIQGATFTQEFDVDDDGDLDHQSVRSDLIDLPSGGVTGVDAPAIQFNVTVNCPDTGTSIMTLTGTTSVLAPVVDSSAGNDTDTHDVTANSFGKADLSVSKGTLTVGGPGGGLFQPTDTGGSAFNITMPVTVRNNGPDDTLGTFAVLTPSSTSDPSSCTVGAPTVTPDDGPYDLDSGTDTGTANTESFNIDCLDGAANSVTFTFNNVVSLGGGSFLSDINASNNSQVKTVTLLKDTDGDGVANTVDNCPVNDNAGQTDSDGDGDGNACDSTPSHDVAASNLVATNSHTAFTFASTSFSVTARATNNSGHTDDLTLALTIDDTNIPGGCSAGVSLISGSAGPTLADAAFEDVTYQVTLSGCGSTGFGSIEITFGATHVNVGGTHGDETALTDNTVSQTVSINVGA